MSNRYKVEGKEGLEKDPRTHAVINVDRNSYETARAHKKRLLQERDKQRSLEQRINKLEDAIERLLQANEDKQ